MNKKELPNDWKPDLKPKTELEQKKLDIQKEIMHLENERRYKTNLTDVLIINGKIHQLEKNFFHFW